MDKMDTLFSYGPFRGLAARLGYFVSRGPGTGELGNITRLLGALAAAYRRDEDGTAAALRALLGEAAQEGKAAA